MNSKPVYYEEPYRTKLEAVVLAIGDDGVILDKTICYPEGGGQSGDRGTLGGCRLLDTVKGKDGAIVHKVENPTFSVGERILIELDWAHRYHYMQMHTAQHIASGILHTHFKIGTVSVHQGEKILTIETDRDKISLETCYALEDLVNRSIREGHPVRYAVKSHEEATALPLRRSIKVASEEVRLVVVEGHDVVACGGLHVEKTSEVTLFQYEGQEKLRGHVRLIFSVGKEAIGNIRKNRALVDKLCTLHSAKPDTLLAVETRLMEQVGHDRYLLEKKSEKVASLLLQDLVQKAEKVGGIPLVLWEVDDDVDVKHVASAFAQWEDLALCAAKQENGKLLWLVGLAGKASSLLDFKKEKKRLLDPIAGRGGGRDSLFQGVGEAEVSTLFATFSELIHETH